jgi:hypothetical protein
MTERGVFSGIPSRGNRAEVIATADDELLEPLRQRALSRMAMIPEGSASDEYADLELFAGDIEREQRMREIALRYEK